MHVSIGPAAVKQKKIKGERRAESLSEFVWELSRQPQATPLCIVYIFFFSPLSLSLCVFVSLPGEPHAHSSVCLFYVLPLLLLLLSLPHARREILLAPGGSFPPHRPAPAGSCCHWAEGKKRRRSRRRRVGGGGAFSFQPPRCNKTNGACIFSSTGLHPPIMSPFFPPPSLPGLKGGREKKKKKKIRHSTSFSRSRLRFPDVQICLLWV